MNRVLIGDVREKLLEIPDGSIQMCVTSPPLDTNTVKYLAGQVKLFTLLDIGITERPIGYSEYLAAMVVEVSVARDLCPMLTSVRLQTPQSKDDGCRFFLDSEEWQKELQDAFSLLIGCLIAIQWTALCYTRLFFVVPPAKPLGDKFDCRFVYHADLNASLIAWVLAFLACCAFLNSNVCFAIYKPGHVSNLCLFHVSSNSCGLCDYTYKFGENQR